MAHFRFKLLLAAIATCLLSSVPSYHAYAEDPIVVPDAVKMARPSEQEISTAKVALKRFLDSADADTKAVLDKFPSLLEVRPPTPNSAVIPNLARPFRTKHQRNIEVAKQGEAELLLMGDSITDFWRNENGPFAGKSVLDKNFGQWKVANFGIAGDTTQGVLFRLRNGEGQGIHPRAIMLMIGTNNTGSNSADEIAEGVGAVVAELHKDFPEAEILLLAIFPRGSANDPVREKINRINEKISRLDDGIKVHYLDIGQKFLDTSGNIPKDVMSDALHPSTKGYEIWADAVKEPLEKLMAAELAGSAK
jgi:lysophospholipase L1-like esterase